jgi:hypothetical protein
LVCSDEMNKELDKRFELLTTDGTVFDAQKLGLVVTRDGGIGVYITGKHGEGSGEILRLHVLFLSYRYFYKLRVSDYLLIYFYTND